MGERIRYRGRDFGDAEIEALRRLIADNPGLSRRRLSQVVCQLWGWRQANGQLCDMVCRGLLLKLHREGQLELPPKRREPANPLALGRRRKPSRIEVDQTPIVVCLRELGPLQIRQVRRTALEALHGSLIEYHHPLGYTQPVGEHLKYLVFAADRPVGCLAFSSAARHLGPRDRFIGWTASQRRASIHLLAYNTRFLIPDWVRVPHLASHLVGRIARRICSDWQSLYHHPIYLLETFTDPQRSPGTCYRAANWLYVGLTTGRGKADQTNRPNRSLKAVWVYPLTKDFRKRLCAQPA
jgi:hypothetical protein